MWRVLMAILVGLVVGCSRPIGSTSVPAPSSVPFAALSEPEQKAVQAARQLLGRRGASWGQPESVKLTPDAKAYWVTYPTPESERSTLGPRVIAVEVTTGEAKLVMRD
jgi:hypothetical protein